MPVKHIQKTLHDYYIYNISFKNVFERLVGLTFAVNK